MTTSSKTRNRSGFTLVELLVVIAILAVLATLGTTVGMRMLAKGKATTMINNLRQMAPLLSIYAADNNMSLMPCKSPQVQPDGTVEDMIWHELMLSLVYPEIDPLQFKTEEWWQANDSNFLKNPLFKETDTPLGWAPLNPGYGYNIKLVENYSMVEDDSIPAQDELEAISIPMSILDRPARTPILAPCDNYYYRYDATQILEFENGTIKNFLSENKFPILFLSGHVEMVRPVEYVTRHLDDMPYDPEDEEL